MAASQRITSLFKDFAKVLKPHGFKREEDVAGIVMFGRRQEDLIERVSFLPATGGSNPGSLALTVSMGVEFTDLAPERYWIGTPRTHGSIPLRILNKSVKKEPVCTADCDLKEFVFATVDHILEASDELLRRREKLRKAYISLVGSRGSSIRKRLEIFAARKANEQKCRPTKNSKSVAMLPLNPFDIACKLLKAKQDKQHEIESRVFDDVEAHDRRLTRKVQQEFIDKAKAIQTELATVLDTPYETGETEHKQLPINGVCYFAFWYVGWKVLYIAVSHEDIGLPCFVLMGAASR